MLVYTAEDRQPCMEGMIHSLLLQLGWTQLPRLRGTAASSVFGELAEVTGDAYNCCVHMMSRLVHISGGDCGCCAARELTCSATRGCQSLVHWFGLLCLAVRQHTSLLAEPAADSLALEQSHGRQILAVSVAKEGLPIQDDFTLGSCLQGTATHG